MPSPWPARPRALRFVVIAALILATLTPVIFGAAPPQPLPTQRVDLKVLVVGITGGAGDTEPAYEAWQSELRREGVPFDARLASSVNDSVLADYGANHAKYQAVIVATGVGSTPTPPTAPFPAVAAAALTKLESTFGIRQISEIGDTFDPSTFHGFSALANPPGYSDQTGNTAQLTPLGRQVFPYLNGSVPIQGPGAFGFQGIAAAPVLPGAFQPLLNGPTGGSTYLGIYTDPIDLRQEMVMTVTSNEFQLHNQLLRHGMLNWVTRGVYLGTQRSYFTLHIDDIFLPDAKWDSVANTTPGNAAVPTCALAGVTVPCPEVRMEPNDVRDAIVWQNTNGLRLDLLFNRQGIQDAIDANAAKLPPVAGDPLTDDLTNGLLARKSEFRWMNHTDTHAQLDAVSLPEATSEITNNNTFAATNALPGYNPAEIVTGEHSGIGSYQGAPLFGAGPNNNVFQAFTDKGIRWVGDDNSVRPVQRPVGPALTVPRYPSNVYYNVASRDDQLDEYNYIYLPPPAGACVNTAVTTCRATPALWADYLASETGIMFGHLMGNDPKPHYAHQSNLITNHVVPGATPGTTVPAPDDGLGILYKRVGVAGAPGVIDELLTRYKSYFNVNAPLVQSTLTEAGQLLQKKSLWDGHVAGGRASGYLLDGKVHVVATQGMEAPITGVTTGELYGGQRSGWSSVGAGDTAFTPADPINVTPPTLSGAAAVNSTLTAAPGSWLGTTPVPSLPSAHQWQRCNGPLCVNITGVTDLDYKIGTIDKGFGLRIAEMNGNWISSVSQEQSTTTVVPGPPPPPGFPPTAPGPGNVLTSTLNKLTLTNLKVAPRRFKAGRVKAKKQIGGTSISWRLNAVAKVNIVVQKKKGKKWLTVGAIQRDARAGNTKLRFTGQVGKTLIKPGAYRFAISAKRTNVLKTGVQTITFTFLRG